MLDKDT
jgi:transcription initiation factor IIF auxiliary subunit